MPRDKKNHDKEIKQKIKQQVAAHVRNAFPGCVAEFCGRQGRLPSVSRTFGFRVRDRNGKYQSNIVWVDPGYQGEINEAWVRWAVSQSNG